MPIKEPSDRHLLLTTSGPQMFDQIFGQVFDQGFDQGLGEGTNHKYKVQFYPTFRKKIEKTQKKHQEAVKPSSFFVEIEIY